MRKLLILTAVALLTASMVGCGCGRWFRRGAAVPCYPTEPCCSPCETPCVTPGTGCDSCATPSYGAMPVPGPETYVPTS